MSTGKVCATCLGPIHYSQGHVQDTSGRVHHFHECPKNPVTVTEEGDANFYMLANNERWLARVQMNGELSVDKQRELMAKMAEALG